jgi:hypothetical protein
MAPGKRSVEFHSLLTLDSLLLRIGVIDRCWGHHKKFHRIYLALEDVEELHLARRVARVLAGLVMLELHEVSTLQAAKQILVGSSP